MQYDLKTYINGDFIVQDLTLDLGNGRGPELLSRNILQVGEDQTRAALIKLGWTPPSPDGSSEVKRLQYHLEEHDKVLKLWWPVVDFVQNHKIGNLGEFAPTVVLRELQRIHGLTPKQPT